MIGRVNPVGGSWSWLVLGCIAVCGRWLLESRGSHYSLSGPESGESKPDVSRYPSSLLHTQTKTDILAYKYRRLQVQTAQTMTPISVHDKPAGLPACRHLNVWRQAPANREFRTGVVSLLSYPASLPIHCRPRSSNLQKSRYRAVWTRRRGPPRQLWSTLSTRPPSPPSRRAPVRIQPTSLSSHVLDDDDDFGLNLKWPIVSN